MPLRSGFGDCRVPQLNSVENLEAFYRAAQAEAFEQAAVVCETAEIPIDIDVWMGTKKALTAATAIGLAKAIRALKEK
jgi:hypothetical protein